MVAPTAALLLLVLLLSMLPLSHPMDAPSPSPARPLVRTMYDPPMPRLANGSMDTAALLEQLEASNANSVSFMLWSTTGDAYLRVVEFLEGTKHRQGSPTVWITLMPPSGTEIGQNTTGCRNASALCPASHKYPYGNADAGWYCCPSDPKGANCPGKHAACCVAEGLREGCQGVPRCGSNPGNFTVCHKGGEPPGKASCSIPADSPLTNFDETALVNQSMGYKGCNDYLGWSDILGRLGQLYPALKYLNIDDFTANLRPVGPSQIAFTPALVSDMKAKLKRGGVKLVPVHYFSAKAETSFVLKAHPWLVDALDGALFYPLGPCNASEVPRFKAELQQFAAVLGPASKQLHAGMYFSHMGGGCESNGTDVPPPSYCYDSLEMVLQLANSSGAVAGATIYTMSAIGEASAESCPPPSTGGQPAKKPCIVRELFGRYASTPAAQPARAAAAPQPLVELGVDWASFLGKADHVWDWRWTSRHVVQLSSLSADLQHCGGTAAASAPGPCCVVATGGAGSVQLGPCASVSGAQEQWVFGTNGSLVSALDGRCLSLRPAPAPPPLPPTTPTTTTTAPPPPPPPPPTFLVAAAACSANSTVWIQHQNAFMALNLPAADSAAPLPQLTASHGPPAHCLAVDTAGADWCNGIICARSSARPLTSGSRLVVKLCHNGDRRQYFQTKTVGTTERPSVDNFVPLSWSTAAYVGNGLLGVRVQNDGVTVGQGSRTLGSVGSLRIEIDNLLLGQGKRRQANGYWRLGLAPNSSAAEHRVQMRTRLHQAIIEGNVTDLATGALVSEFTLFAAANLSLPVVVLQCRRFDGAGCSLTFVNETQQDFSWHHTETSGVGSLAAEGSGATRTLTAFAALSASRHGPVSGKIVAAAVAKGRPQILQEHLSWWAKYWPQSFVSLGGGDAATRVEQHYWTQMYRFPVSDRVALNGIIGSLGPTGFSGGNWNSDYYGDMNEELMYWISPASNRPEIAAGIRNVVPEGGASLWMLHNSYKQYDFEGDEESLRKVIWPALRTDVETQVGSNNSKVGPNGTLHLGRCNSPEYGCFAPFGSAPFGSTCKVANGHYSDCAYALSQLRWGLTVLLKLNKQLGMSDPAAGWWQALLDRQLAPFPTDETGYKLSSECPFACPHRHFSHLLQIYDLQVVDPASPLSLKSIDHYHSLTCNESNWFVESCRGYSVCGIAGMNAVAGRRSAAQGNISFSIDTIIVPNGLYGENEMMNHPDEFGPTGESSYCLAGVLHTMLSHTTRDGVLQIFGGLGSWDASFHDLRAAGGLLVSAVRRNGTAEFVRVRSSSARKVASVGADGQAAWGFELQANESVVLHAVGVAGPPFRIEPQPSNRSEEHWFGYTREFPPQK